MPDFYIVPPRLIVGSFDRAAVVNSINTLKGDLTFTADPLTGVKLVTSGNNIQIGFIPDYFIKKAGDYVTGNIQFTPSGSNYGLQLFYNSSDPATGATGALYFNTTDNQLKIYDNTGWNVIQSTSGISVSYANANYLRLDATNDPMQGDLDMGTYFFRVGRKATQVVAGVSGQLYYNTDNNRLDLYNGSAWVPVGQGITSITVGTGLTSSQNPIVSVSTLSVNTAANFTWTGNHTFNSPVIFAASAQTFNVKNLFITGQAEGDLITYSGGNWTRYGIGATDYVLRVNSAGTGVTWGTAPATGITSINSLTTATQYFSTGSSGNFFNIVSSGSTHTFNIPLAGTGSTGLVSNLAQSFAGVKTFTSNTIVSSSTASTNQGTGALTIYGGLGISGNASIGQTLLFFNNGSSYYIGLRSGTSTTSITYILPISGPSTGSSVLQSDTSGNLTWVPMAASGITGTVTVPQGGTGYTTYTNGTILVGAGSTFIQLLPGTQNYVLTSSNIFNSGIGWSYVSGAAITSTPPSPANVSQFWWDNQDGSLSIYYDDGNGTAQWVEVISGYVSGSGGTGSGSVSQGEQYSVGYYPSAGTLVTGSSNFKYNSGSSDTLILGGMTIVGSGDNSIQITNVGNGGQILSTWNTLNSGLALDAANASLRIVGDTNAGTTLVDLGVYSNSGFPVGTWTSKYLFPKTTEAIFVNGLNIQNTTNSTNPSLGALKIAGGLGVSGNASIGQSLLFFNSSNSNYVAFKAGASSASTTYTLPLNSPQSASGTSVLSSTIDGVLSWVPMTATGGGGAGTVNNGTIYSIPYYPSAGILITGSSNFVNVGTGISILYTTASNSTSTGALVVNGGVGISKDLNVGGQINGVIITSGIITSGVWAGTTITSYYGGTGYQAYSTGDLLVGTGATLTKFNVGPNNTILVADNTQGTGISWKTLSNVSGTFIGLGNTTVGLGTTLNLVAGSGITITYVGNSLVFRSAVAITSSYPSGPSQGDLVWNNEEGSLKIYYNDGQDEGQWVDASQRWASGPAIGGTGGSGSGTVDQGLLYSIPYYPSAGTLITGSSNFTNVGTGISVLYSANSTSTSTGALVINGGIGIGLSASIGGRLQLFNGSNYSAFVFAGSSNTTYTLPNTSPATGSSVLQSTSAGILSWVPMTATGGGGAAVSTDAPLSPSVGDLWWNSGQGNLKVYYTDPNNDSYWVDASAGSEYSNADREKTTVILAAGYTPASSGADVVEIPAPYSSNDGTTVLTFNVKRLFVRVGTSGSGSTVRFEVYTGTGAFIGSTIGDVSVSSSTYEAATTSGFAVSTVQSGNKLRLNFKNLGSEQYFTCGVELAE